MSNKKKKTTTTKSGNKPKKTDAKGFKQEKTESINLKALARDERTWKITGAVSLLIALFLFISFISYFFSWHEDNQSTLSQQSAILFDNDVRVNNLAGKLGALASYFFISVGFGVASLLICTFFFVVGANLLFSRKFFSIWGNLKYVTIGMLVLSVSLAFIFGPSGFSWGGTVGNMISHWMIGIFGRFGTAALLFVIALAYIIWQFNPKFNLPAKKAAAPLQSEPVEEGGEKLFIETSGNRLKTNGEMVINPSPDEELHDFKIIEKEEDEPSVDRIASPVAKGARQTPRQGKGRHSCARCAGRRAPPAADGTDR